MPSTQETAVSIARIEERLAAMDAKWDARFEMIQRECAEKTPKIEFEPIRKIVYGGISCICLAVLAGLMALVVRGPEKLLNENQSTRATYPAPAALTAPVPTK